MRATSGASSRLSSMTPTPGGLTVSSYATRMNLVPFGSAWRIAGSSFDVARSSSRDLFLVRAITQRPRSGSTSKTEREGTHETIECP